MIDLTELYKIALEYLLAPAALALGGWLIAWLMRQFKLAGLEVDANVRAYLDNALSNAVDYGLRKARAAGRGRAGFDVESEAVRDAANYVAERVPDAIAHFKLKPGDVEKLIRSRLPPVRD